ncbi:hypothetical protein EON66_03170 [archaeon]|nr:MAG: hypothetical protein EON66_03170 [archaeon]
MWLQDAYMNGEEIVLWPFQDAHAGKEFSPEPFWATILSPDAAVGAGAVPALPGVRPDVGQALAGGSMVCPTDDTFEALRANLLQRAIPRRVVRSMMC